MKSPTGAGTINGNNTLALTGPGGPHHVNGDYFKNIMLQFLNTKEKRIQLQLIPVLSQLLKFNKYVNSASPCVFLDDTNEVWL